MPDERIEEIQKTRKCKPDPAQTNGQGKHHGTRVEGKHGRNDSESGEKFRIKSSNAGRRNSPGCENPKHYLSSGI